MNKQEYRQANINWLKAKAQEEGVKALPRGIYYKVISEGKNDGIHPTPRNVVTAHYTGWTIDGKVFDSSRDEGVPIAFRLCDLIEGWIIAINEHINKSQNLNINNYEKKHYYHGISCSNISFVR